MSNNVSVVLPAYNSAKFLPAALDSLFAQTQQPYEIIVVDDGSTEDSKAVCERYPSVRYIYQENQGTSGARNTGLRLSTGDYVIFLDADDLLLPQAIEIGARSLDEHPEAGLTFGRYHLFSIQADGSFKVAEMYENQPAEANYLSILSAQHKIQLGCVMFRRSALDVVGGFDAASYPLEDIEQFLRVARHYPLHFHNQLVSEYRYTGNNVSSKSASMLVGSLRAHERQLAYVQQVGDPVYQEAYEKGRASWIKLFGDRLPYDIIKCVHSDKWVTALGLMYAVLYFDPQLRIVDRQIFEAARSVVLSNLRAKPFEKSLAYWKTQLQGAPTLLPLLTDRPRPPRQNYSGHATDLRIPGELCASLGRVAEKQGTSLCVTLLAAYFVLLYRYTGVTDIVVGCPLVSKRDTETFVNGVPLRCDLSGTPSFNELVLRLKRAVDGAHAHQEVPFCLMQEQICPEPDPSYAPIYQATFVFDDEVPMRALDLAHLTAGPWVIKGNEGKFDLTLHLQKTGHGLTGMWTYAADLFDARTIERMNEHFMILLQGIAETSDESIARLPLISASERRQMLEDWNATASDYPRERCFYELIAEQAAATPDAIAVVFGDQQISYQDLNSRANQLAHYLQKLGVQPDSLVGI